MLFSMNFNSRPHYEHQRRRTQSMAMVGKHPRRARLDTAMEQIIEEKKVEPPNREEFEKLFAPLNKS